MKKYIIKALNVIRKEGISEFAKKSYRNIRNQIKRISVYNFSNKKKFLQIKDSFLGKRVFLIGNGPSLNLTPLYLLKNEYTMAFNRFNLLFERLNWKPSFYSVIDSVVAKDMAEEINLVNPQVKYAFFPDIHADGTVFKKFIRSSENVYWLKPGFGDFNTSLPDIILGGTVSFAAIQILIFLGFKEIILIGVDMNYKIHTTVDTLDGNTITAKYDDDPNHFDPRYFGSQRSYHQPDQAALVSMFNAFEKAAVFSTKNGCKIINAGYNSAVECFPKVEFSSLFNYTFEQKLDLFLESMNCKGNFKSIKEALTDLVEVTCIEDWNEDATHLAVDQSLASIFINTKINSHIPYGPFEGKIIFKKRN